MIARHFDRVYRIAWRVLGGPADAEDVAQEAFLSKAWTAPGQIRDGRAIGAWLARVATNLALDRLRRRRPGSPAELPDLTDPHAAADRGVRRAALEAEVAKAMAALPDRQRAALVLVHFEGLGNLEAAEALGVSVEAVESPRRARRSLKRRHLPTAGGAGGGVFRSVRSDPMNQSNKKALERLRQLYAAYGADPGHWRSTSAGFIAKMCRPSSSRVKATPAWSTACWPCCRSPSHLPRTCAS